MYSLYKSPFRTYKKATSLERRDDSEMVNR